MTDEPSKPELAAELEDLRARLAEAEEALRAIRIGEVDAVVVAGERGEQVYTLAGADRVYRQLIETMSEGAVALSANGVILYCNVRLAEMLGRPLDHVLGTDLRSHLPPADRQTFDAILAEARTGPSRREIKLKTSEGRTVPVYLSASHLHSGEAEINFCLVITDLTEQKRHEQTSVAERLARLILEQATEAIVVCDEAGRVIRISKAAQRFCVDSPRKRPFAEVFPLQTGASEPFHLAPVFQGETLRNVDVTLDRQGKRLDLILNAGQLLSGQQILGCIVTLTNITERKHSERELKESEEKFRVIFEGSKDGIMLVDAERRKIHTANSTFCDMLQYSLDEVSQLGVLDIHPEESFPLLFDAFERTMTQGSVLSDNFPVKRKDGSIFWADIKSSLMTISGKIFVLGNFRDVTELRLLENQVQTAQRMEAVGTLAGGIAHDFNNSLTGIVGFGHLLRMRMAGDELALHDLDEILRCAERGSTLTRQLLTFARRQVIEPVNLNVSTLVADLMKFIGKVVGEHIEVKTSLEKNVPTIYADRGQIEQVVMNLCLNARDAMPEGGRLVVETEDVYLEEEYVRQNPYMRTGRYTLLTVSDTGSGMDEKTRERVFEPFFTTKGPDKGTGLGLAMVYGIVKQHAGFIHLYSEPGKGSSFKVYFPAVDAPPDVVPGKRLEETVRGGTETILLAEDEETIRALAERILTGFGYTVLVARNGEEAIEIFGRNKGIDLAVLDVVMPRKGGKEAFEEMHKQNPRLKVIFMSGYSADAIHDSFVLIAGTPFLQKPFGPTMLARKVREVLDT